MTDEYVLEHCLHLTLRILDRSRHFRSAIALYPTHSPRSVLLVTRCNVSGEVGANLADIPDRGCVRLFRAARFTRDLQRMGWRDTSGQSTIGRKHALTWMFVERMTGFEPATSTLARHQQPTRPYETVRFNTAQSGRYGPVRGVDGMLDGMTRAAPQSPRSRIVRGGSARRGDYNP